MIGGACFSVQCAPLKITKIAAKKPAITPRRAAMNAYDLSGLLLLARGSCTRAKWVIFDFVTAISCHFLEFADPNRWVVTVVLPERIELSTSPLPRECSTPELRQRRPTFAIGGRARQVPVSVLPPYLSPYSTYNSLRSGWTIGRVTVYVLSLFFGVGFDVAPRYISVVTGAPFASLGLV